jgi:hypothetical protein
MLDGSACLFNIRFLHSYTLDLYHLDHRVQVSVVQDDIKNTGRHIPRKIGGKEANDLEKVEEKGECLK